jgi:hypothetical protein
MAKIDVFDLQPSKGYDYLETVKIMRNLTHSELTQISGGFKPTPDSPVSGYFRGGFRPFALGVGAVWVAFYGGWEAGQWLNENTPIQEWLSDSIGALSRR